MSKGSKYRPVDRAKFDSSWDKIFKKDERNTTMWEHSCKHNGQMSLAKGEECSWCGEKEDKE